MDNNFKYHPNEKVYDTVESIVDFLTENEASDQMSFSGKAMKLLNQYKERIHQNFYIGSQTLSATNASIMGGAFNGEEKNVRKYIVDNVPIIFVKIGDKEIVIFNIITWKNERNNQTEIAFDYSDYSKKIQKDYRNSMDAVGKYNL